MPVLLVCSPWKVSSRLIRYSCQLLKGTFAKTIRQNLKLVLPQRRGNSNNSLTLKSHLERGRGASNPPALSHHRVLPHCLHPMTAPGSEISSCIISPFPFFFSFLFCSFPFFFLVFPLFFHPLFLLPPFFCFVFNLGQRQAFESYFQVYCTPNFKCQTFASLSAPPDHTGSGQQTSILHSLPATCFLYSCVPGRSSWETRCLWPTTNKPHNHLRLEPKLLSDTLLAKIFSTS